MFYDSDKKGRFILILAHSFIGMGLFFIQVYHASTVFELKTNFSHLTKMEQETLFTDEHGLYFSFYKRIVDEKTFSIGFNKLINDNLTEYPNTINAVHKFHIYPEIFAAFLYKQFMNITTYMGIPNRECWTVVKTHESRAIISCRGPGEPINFYLEFVWYTAGLTVLFLYIFGTYLSNHIFGGISSVIYYFVVNQNATRVHEFPAARENFAFLFILWQMFYLTVCIGRLRTNTYKYTVNNILTKNYLIIIKLAMLTTMAHLCWQFSTFVFATQTIAIFILVQLEMLPQEFVLNYSLAHILANIASFYAMFENKYFFLSLNHSLIVALILYLLFRNFEGEELQMSKTKRFFHDLCFFVSITYFVSDISDRVSINKKSEDINSYFMDLILSKFRFKMPNFSTILYLCNSSYSYIDFETISLYNNVFAVKYTAVLLVILIVEWLFNRKIIFSNPADQIERAKKYVMEDFMEENLITIKDLSDPNTGRKMKSCLDLLMACNYDYNKYKLEKTKVNINNTSEKETFLNDIKKLKNEATVIKQQRKVKKTSQSNDKHSIDNNESNDKCSRSKSFTNLSISSASVHEQDSNNQNKESRQKPEKTDSEQKTSEPSYLSFIRISDIIQTYYLYSLLQTLLFFILALLVLKLKYLLTPFLCLITPSFPPRKWFDKMINLYWLMAIMSLVVSVIHPGFQNIQEQYKPGEYNNLDLQQLIEWISTNTEPNAVFAGPMDITTIVLAATKRPIVNHPHTEFSEISHRTKIVYSIYSKQQSAEIYNELAKLKIQYVILAQKDCFLHTSNGCKMSEIWDFLNPELKTNPRFCTALFQKSIPNFFKVFLNNKYLVLQIFSQSIQLELKKVSLIEYNM